MYTEDLVIYNEHLHILGTCQIKHFIIRLGTRLCKQHAQAKAAKL